MDLRQFRCLLHTYPNCLLCAAAKTIIQARAGPNDDLSDHALFKVGSSTFLWVNLGYELSTYLSSPEAVGCICVYLFVLL